MVTAGALDETLVDGATVVVRLLLEVAVGATIVVLEVVDVVGGVDGEVVFGAELVVVVELFDVVLVTVVGFVVAVAEVVAFAGALAVVGCAAVARATIVDPPPPPPPAVTTCRTVEAAVDVIGAAVEAVPGVTDAPPAPPPRASAVAGPPAKSRAEDGSDSATVTGFGEFETIWTASMPAPATRATAPIPASTVGCSNSGRGIRCLPV